MRSLIVPLLTTVFAAVGAAQTTPAARNARPACDGNFATVRLSDAFVKLYRDNSEIKQQYNVCLPKPGLR